MTVLVLSDEDYEKEKAAQVPVIKHRGPEGTMN
jgi:hypothetical protein